jgi:hypothetical protein
VVLWAEDGQPDPLPVWAEPEPNNGVNPDGYTSDPDSLYDEDTGIPGY